MAKITTGKKLTNPQMESPALKIISVDAKPYLKLSPVSDAALDLQRDPKGQEEGRNRSALPFPWDCIC